MFALSSNAAKTLDGGAAILREVRKVIARPRYSIYAQLLYYDRLRYRHI